MSTDESNPGLLPTPRGSLRALRPRRQRLGEILQGRGLITEEQLTSALAEQSGLELVDPRAVRVDAALLVDFDEAIARRHRVLPLRGDGGDPVTLAVDDPDNLEGSAAAATFLDRPVTRVLSTPSALTEAIEALFATVASAPKESDHLELPEEPPPVGPIAAALGADPSDPAWKALLRSLLAHALRLRADRVRFTSWDGGASARIRIDRRWAEALRLQAGPASVLAPALGLALGLEPEGRGFAAGERVLSLGDRTWSVAASMRELEPGLQVDLELRDPEYEPEFDALGLPVEVLRRLRQWTAARAGLLLVVGDEASGRSTTLRALARSLAEHRSVELVSHRAPPSQANLRWSAGSRGVAAIREALAREPRVLVVDDADDDDAARTAFSAARDDCLVVAGVRGHDAHDALQSLRERGVPDAVMGTRLVGLVEQRLVRVLCRDCAEAGPPEASVVRRLGLAPASTPGRVPRPGHGCPTCGGVGYRGQTPLATRVELSGGVQEGCRPAELRGAVDRARPLPASEAGLALVLAGTTSLQEVAAALAPPPVRPVLQARGGGWVPGMPEETVDATGPAEQIGESLTIDGPAPSAGEDPGGEALELDDVGEGRALLLFDPAAHGQERVEALLGSADWILHCVSEWEEAMSLIRTARPTALLLRAAADRVATQGRIRAFRDDLSSAFLPVIVLAEAGADRDDLLRWGADDVVPLDQGDAALGLALDAALRRAT